MPDTPSAAPSPIPCGDCGMQCTPGEYHPYAACLMFRACGDSTVVRANLDAMRAQPTPPPVVEPLTDEQVHKRNPYKHSRGAASIWLSGFRAAELWYRIKGDSNG